MLDWVCEVVFNIFEYGNFLWDGLKGVCVMDVFVGMGVMGLEVLFCGVSFVNFVDVDVVV